MAQKEPEKKTPKQKPAPAGGGFLRLVLCNDAAPLRLAKVLPVFLWFSFHFENAPAEPVRFRNLTFNDGKGNQPRGKGCRLWVHVTKRPLSLCADTFNFRNGIEQPVLLLCVANVRVNEQRVHFRMHVLSGNLKAVKETCFRDLHVFHKVECQILIDNPITGCKEREDICDKVSFVVRETLPVLHIAAEVDFLDRPKGSLSLFVHVPNLRVLNREQHKAILLGGTPHLGLKT